jgi:hypothetical protein
MQIRYVLPLLFFIAQTSHANVEQDLTPRYNIPAPGEDWEPISREELQRLYVEENDSGIREEQIIECDKCTESSNKPEYVFDKGNVLILRAVSQ